MGANNSKSLLVPEPLLAAVAAQIADSIGMHFPPERWSDLTRAIHSIAADLGFETIHACAAWLAHLPADKHHAEMLARHLTVGETYFFREPASFNALRDDILPRLLRERSAAGQRRLRFWSAGCATGEEAYSLAIILEMMIPDLADWDIRIQATDINPVALRLAAHGQYRAWSFRNVPANLKTGYFQTRDDGWFELNERIRKRVAFSLCNLTDDIQFMERADIILCRNVLMYFTPQNAAAAIEKLAGHLTPDGCLVVGAAETANFICEKTGLTKYEGAPIYSKGPVSQPTASYESVQVTAAPEPVAGPVAPVEPQSDAPGIAQFLDEARVQGNAGKLKEALSLVEDAIAADKADVSARFLQASILLELNARAEAAAAYDRVLYLAPDFAMAQYMRGILALQDNNRSRALQDMEATLTILSRRHADAFVPEADGLTAAQLSDLATATIDLIKGAP